MFQPNTITFPSMDEKRREILFEQGLGNHLHVELTWDQYLKVLGS